MTTVKISVDMDKKCSKCGKGDAVAENKAGLCMACITKIMIKRSRNKE